MEKLQSTADAAKLTQYSAPEWDYFKFEWDFIKIKFETIQSWYTNSTNRDRSIACFEIGTFNICTLEGIQGKLETLRNVVEAMLDCSHEYIVNFVILMVS